MSLVSGSPFKANSYYALFMVRIDGAVIADNLTPGRQALQDVAAYRTSTERFQK